MFWETDLNWCGIDNSCVFEVHQASSCRGSSGVSVRNTCLPKVQLNHLYVPDTLGISGKKKPNKKTTNKKPKRTNKINPKPKPCVILKGI